VSPAARSVGGRASELFPRLERARRSNSLVHQTLDLIQLEDQPSSRGRAATKGALGLAPPCLLAATLALGCGGGQTAGSAFDTTWSSDDGASIAAFQKTAASVPRGADVVVAVVGGDKLVGRPLDGRARWTYSHTLSDRPALAGSVVVGLGGGELFALDAITGKELWKREVGGRLRGVGDDGKTTVVSLRQGTGKGSVVLAVRRDGSVQRQIEDDAAIGVPSVLGRHALLPWKGQYVTVFDLDEGREVARALLRAQTSHVLAVGGALYFGEVGATRLDESIGAAHRAKATTFTLPARELPGAPRWLTAGTEPREPSWTAADKIRLVARPDGAVSTDGRYVATYYRLALGLDARSGALTWVSTHDADFMGGAQYPGGFALCDAAGRVVFLDASSGAEQGRLELGEKSVELCMVQADGFERRTGGAARGPLAEQLAAAVQTPSAELVAAQKLLLRELVALPDEAATRALLALVTSPGTPPGIFDDARAALATRTQGTESMLTALAARFDYLAGVTRPAPVGPLADALALAGEKRAAPLLALHLREPASSPDDVKRAAAALASLAGPSELSALLAFFAMHRGIELDDDLAEALGHVAIALVRLGAREAVVAASQDGVTTARLRPRLERALAASKPAPPTPAAPSK
jgi:outer membrane protein assembly factor BamB